ncbi:hypothetical protein BD779DRAFT_1470370 [Infundibulicybe gibba]|nr:hypothetical protein BD779DRAFT_1470370 [Infundibulicybe gibba]
MSSSPDINYVKLFGFESVAAAIIFAILYMPLLGWFVRQSIARPTYVFRTLALFCAIRVTAFIIRAVLAGSNSAGHNLGLLIGDEILSASVSSSMLLSDSSEPTSVFARLATDRRIFRLAMIAAVVLGIVGVSNAKVPTPTPLTLEDPPDSRHSYLPRPHHPTGISDAESRSAECGESWGVKHGSYVLCAISLFLLIREAFATATSNDATSRIMSISGTLFPPFRRFLQ